MNTHIATLAIAVAVAGLASSADARSSTQLNPTTVPVNAPLAATCTQGSMRKSPAQLPSVVQQQDDALTDQFVTEFNLQHLP
jgi:hypothetical protein